MSKSVWQCTVGPYKHHFITTNDHKKLCGWTTDLNKAGLGLSYSDKQQPRKLANAGHELLRAAKAFKAAHNEYHGCDPEVRVTSGQLHVTMTDDPEIDKRVQSATPVAPALIRMTEVADNLFSAAQAYVVDGVMGPQQVNRLHGHGHNIFITRDADVAGRMHNAVIEQSVKTKLQNSDHEALRSTIAADSASLIQTAVAELKSIFEASK